MRSYIIFGAEVHTSYALPTLMVAYNGGFLWWKLLWGGFFYWADVDLLYGMAHGLRCGGDSFPEWRRALVANSVDPYVDVANEYR